ncbi:TPA: hypothetical protein U1629_001180 [Streptococcus suis]|uniref:hypothetical protein n=1 Tax=Streptococcus suis TaxID=1307 RepID=UPI000CF4243E|nr:hypothetical protein [Streptococcus suis]MCK4074210.1 hypothetical protein [Streptococcus suis]NQO21838.1 hypothetical protein [Streptococcus suis]NQP14139.1 hypothetical protein [Streptococcus suis]HEM5120265.1 hypothetical protein [Streptococcus suis]HEM5174769.1 hypothetical protein [Streptococcus suis]
MVFRKTANEYVKKNVGELQPYKEGTYIDLNNNVYHYDGLEYIKIGYDNPNLDTWVSLVPQIGVGVILANLFAPKSRKEDSFDIWTWLIGILLALIFLWWYRVFAFAGYKLLTLFIRPILESTEKAKWLRLFLPFLWFVEDPDKDLVDVAAGSTMLLPYIVLSIPVLALANYDVPELKPVGIVLILCTLLSAFYMFINVRINRDNCVDKF